MRRQFEIAVDFGRLPVVTRGRRGGVRAILVSLLMAQIAAVCVGVGCVGYSSPAFARDDDEGRSNREEAQRQREDAQRQRQEAQRQRQEAQRQRQEAERQRQEAQAQAQAQREAARQEREAARQERTEARSSTRDDTSDTRSSQSSDTRSSQSNATSTQRDNSSDTRNSQSNSGNSQRETTSAQKDNSDDDSDTKPSGGRSGSASNKQPSKQSANGDGKSKNSKQNTSRDKDKSDDDATDDDNVAPVEPEVQPPRTLVDWWKNITGGSSASNTPAGSSKAPSSSQHSTAHDDGDDNGSKAQNQNQGQTQAKTNGEPATSKTGADTKKAVRVPDNASLAASNGVKSGGFDRALMDLGMIRERQILASGLDASSAEKAKAMGFATVAKGKSPAYSAPVLLLAVPQGISEDAAQKRLAEVFPSGHFGPNHVYRIYPAAEEAKSAAGSAEAHSCAGPECFARKLISWDKRLSACAENVRIGVIDTSFDVGHPAFGKRHFAQADFRTRGMSLKDDWHGTAVLGILASVETSANPGLVPGADFLLASTFGADNKGAASADAMAVLNALSWLDQERAGIVNMSFSGPSNAEIQTAINAMAAKGVIFVAAGGNQGAYGAASYPAAYPEVIAVTAVRSDAQSYAHATHGDYIDLAAPGVDVYTALPLGQAGLRTGTSFSAPFVTALIAAMPGARKGIRDKYDLLARISKTDLGAPGRDPTFGEGLPIAPKSCNEIGGVASLPWTPEGQRLQQPSEQPVVVRTPAPTVTGSVPGRNVVPAGSAMGSAFGFMP